MTKEKKITKEMTIGEVAEKFPDSMKVLLENGIHCIGCAAAHWENLEQGLSMHGKSEEEIDSMINEMNKIALKKK